MMKPHKWYKYKQIPWLVCVGCGLVALRNEITRWCIRHGCDYDEHPGYKAAFKRLAGKK